MSDRDRELDALRRRAERAEAELRELAHVVAHDLRSPLAAVIGYLELLAVRYEDQLEVEANDFLTRARTGAGRLGDMLTGLSRLAQLPVAIQAQPIPWRAVVSAAIAELPDTFAEHVQRITVTEPLPDVSGDPEQLRVLVGELLDNALRHHDTPGDASVVVRASEGGALVIEDDGPGIADNLLDRVREPFKTGGRPGPNGGVGLAIAEHLAVVHGGELSLYRGPAGGLRVAVHLPA